MRTARLRCEINTTRDDDGDDEAHMQIKETGESGMKRN